jgi:hypothetical protein
MRVLRPALAVSLAAALVGVASCGDHLPPILGDNDASTGQDVFVPPCAAPQTGCPCPDAGVIEVCGTEYHYAGTYVTCSKEYITCQADGTWGPCVGANVFGAE